MGLVALNLEKIKESPDEEVLGLSLKQPSLFEVIVDRYQEAFLRKARTVLGSRPEVEDAVQETFTKIYLNASRFKPVSGASFKSWGYKILLNTTFSYYQRLKKRDGGSAELSDELLAIIPGKDTSFQESSLRDAVASVLTRMPSQLAKVLKLHFLDDRPHKEIAELEGISVAAVKTRVHRAKKEFRKIQSEIGNF